MNEPAASIPDALGRLIEATEDGNVSRWRSATAAEVAAHNETKNVMAGVVRQRDANAAEVARLTSELGTALRRLARAQGILGEHNLVMPEDVKHTPGDWYGCAVCSQKTDAAPIMTRRHACCGRNANVGPCCQGAVDRSAEDVTSIMVGAGHQPGCRG